MKATRICFLLLAAFLCCSTCGLAQANAKPDYYHQHKDGEKYQKHQKNLMKKQQRKQEKAHKKAAQAIKQQHQ